MSDHEIFAAEVPGGVEFQALEDKQIPAWDGSIPAMHLCYLKTMRTCSKESSAKEPLPIIFFFDGHNLGPKAKVIIELMV